MPALKTYAWPHLTQGEIGGTDKPGVKAKQLPNTEWHFLVLRHICLYNCLALKTDLQVMMPSVRTFVFKQLIAFQAASFIYCSFDK